MDTAKHLRGRLRADVYPEAPAQAHAGVGLARHHYSTRAPFPTRQQVLVCLAWPQGHPWAAPGTRAPGNCAESARRGHGSSWGRCGLGIWAVGVFGHAGRAHPPSPRLFWHRRGVLALAHGAGLRTHPRPHDPDGIVTDLRRVPGSVVGGVRLAGPGDRSEP